MRWRIVVVGAAIVFVGGLGAAVVLYLRREALGVQLSERYLNRLGVPAKVTLDRLDLGGAAGSLRIGPASRPDLVAKSFAVDFGGRTPLGSALAPPPVRAIRLEHVLLRARYAQGRLSFGALQPLVDQALKAKPSGAPAPDVSLKDGRLELQTAAGLVVVRIDGVLRKGRISSLHARLLQGDLAFAAGSLRAVKGVVDLAPAADGGLAFKAEVDSQGGSGPTGGFTAAALTIGGKIPQPADSARTPGRLDAVATLRLGSLTAAGAAARPDRRMRADTIQARVVLNGRFAAASGFTGAGSVDLRAKGIASADASLDRVRLTVFATQVRIRDANNRLLGSTAYRLQATAADGAARHGWISGRLGGVAARSAGRIAFGPDRLSIDARAGVTAAATVDTRCARRLAQGAPAGLRTWAVRAASDLHLAAPEVDIGLRRPGGVSVRLARPLTVAAPGATLVASGTPSAAALNVSRGGAAGAVALALRAPRFGSATLRLSRYRFSRDGAIEATFAAAASGSASGVQDATLELAGRAVGLGDRWRVALDGCAPERVASVAAGGEVAARAVAFQLCPATASPLATFAQGDWRLAAVVRGAQGEAAAAGVNASLAQATLGLRSVGGAPAGEMALDGLTLRDRAKPERFAAVSTGGRVILRSGVASGDLPLTLADRKTPLGRLALKARLTSGEGDARLDTGRIDFSQKGLQPGDIAPALGRLLPQADGGARVSADIAWSPRGATGSADIVPLGLSFKSPAGRLEGLTGQVRLVSLAPLQSAPDQHLTAARLDAFTPVTDLRLVFTLTPSALDIAQASAGLGGGRIDFAPMHAPLKPGADVAGELKLSGVDTDTLIASLNLSKAMSLQAKLGGVVPFDLSPQGLRLRDGRIYAEGPGRLTIHREALVGAPGSAQPNAVQDFAYQAMEDLAFQSLEASVASRPGGRLGIVFHVVGRHDPAIDRPTRIGLFALIQGHAFDKPLPLPKGTPVDLTLDTSLNLDDLLTTYARLNAAGNSPAVQPR